jgi:hypothetical protein
MDRIRVVPDGTRRADYKPGDIGHTFSARPDLWSLRCPRCGAWKQLGRLHNVLVNKDGTLTVSLLIECPESLRPIRDPKRCSARYHIDHNVIHYAQETRPAKTVPRSVRKHERTA